MSGPFAWQENNPMSDDFDLSVPVPSVDFCDQRMGKPSAIEELWEKRCDLQTLICALQTKLDKVDQELLQHDPSFFQPRTSLVGPTSFSFRPKLPKSPKPPHPDLAKRNSIIILAGDMSTERICKRLDSNEIPVPESWEQRFPEVKTWTGACADKECRQLLQTLICDVKSKWQQMVDWLTL